jgi:hypothetical protein
VVPYGTAMGSCDAHAASFDQYAGSQFLIVFTGRNSTCAMAAMLARASPRNPLVRRELRSSAFTDLAGGVSLEAGACIGRTHAPAIVGHLHQGTSCILHTTMIRVAPLSTLFSNNSFTTLAGPLYHLTGRDLVGDMVRQ